MINLNNHFLNTAYTSNIICDVLDKTCNIETKIKWPNDILIKDKKICGIITEIYNKNNETLINTGFGINIISSPKVDYDTTNVNIYNKNIDNIKFVYLLMKQYLSNPNLLKNHSNSILQKYKSRLKYLNKNIKIKLDSNQIKDGFFYDLNKDGSIIFKNKSSYEKIYNARILK